LTLIGQRAGSSTPLSRMLSQGIFYHHGPIMVGSAIPMDSNIIFESNTIKFYRFLYKIIEELFLNK